MCGCVYPHKPLLLTHTHVHTLHAHTRVQTDTHTHVRAHKMCEHSTHAPACTQRNTQPHTHTHTHTHSTYTQARAHTTGTPHTPHTRTHTQTLLCTPHTHAPHTPTKRTRTHPTDRLVKFSRSMCAIVWECACRCASRAHTAKGI